MLSLTKRPVCTNHGHKKRTDTPRNRYRELVCMVMDAKQHIQMTTRTKIYNIKNEIKK